MSAFASDTFGVWRTLAEVPRVRTWRPTRARDTADEQAELWREVGKINAYRARLAGRHMAVTMAGLRAEQAALIDPADMIITDQAGREAGWSS